MTEYKKFQEAIIEPSILSSDFAYLAQEVQRVEQAGADRLHIDIMDGHFVPNITMGPHIVAAINKITPLFLDVHLMIYNPFSYIEQFVKSGADLITFHIEATEDVEDTIAFIKRCGKLAGIALCPDSPISLIRPFLAHIDQVLVMTVNPGFGGQAFLENSLERVEETASLLKEYKKIEPNSQNIHIQVDGGIDERRAIQCAKAGATCFVSGTYLFSQHDMKEGISSMRNKIIASYQL